MKASYDEDLANHDPESCVCFRKAAGEALTEVCTGWVLTFFQDGFSHYLWHFQMQLPHFQTRPFANSEIQQDANSIDHRHPIMVRNQPGTFSVSGLSLQMCTFFAF